MDTLPHSAQNGNPSEKICTGCQTSYPATTEFFPTDKKGKNGLSSRCRKCRNAYIKKYRKNPEVRERRYAQTSAWRNRPENKERIREYNRAYIERLGVREHRLERSHRPARKAHAKAYYSRPEVRERMRLYYSHPDRIERRRAYGRQYNQRPENKERYRLRAIEYRATSEFQEHKKQWRKEYNQRPLIRMRNHVSRSTRRAYLRSACGSHTSEQLQEQYNRQKRKCYYCHTKVPLNRYHIDHVVPLSRGGSNDISNLVIACPSCNLSKHNKLPHEFFQGGRLL